MTYEAPGATAANILTEFETNSGAPQIIRGSKTFTGAANLGAVGDCPIFTTTGAVKLDSFMIRCTSDMVDAVDGALFTIGVTGATAIFADWSAVDLDTLDAGDGINFSAATDGYLQELAIGDVAFPHGVVDSITMTISTQAITGGVLVFYALYRPLSSDGALALGTGMVAA